MINESTSPRISGRQQLILLLRSAGIVVVFGMLWIASGLLVPVGLAALSSRLQAFATIFLGIFIEALPFLLGGVLASSAIHLFVSADLVQRLSPRNPVLAAFAGAFLGLAFPVCECGSIPATRRLLAKGTPLPLGIAFVLAAPAVNPIVIVSTWVAFSGQIEIVIGRILLTILIAIVVGVVIGLHPKPETLLSRPGLHNVAVSHDAPQVGDVSCDGHDHHDDVKQHPIQALLSHANSEFFEMGRYLVIGALIAAALQVVIPRSALLDLAQGPVISVLVLMGMAVVLSICSTVDAFVALSFAQSFTPGAVLAFLVFGPMIDLKSVFMLSTTFRRWVVALMVVLVSQITILAAIIVNLYF